MKLQEFIPQEKRDELDEIIEKAGITIIGGYLAAKLVDWYVEHGHQKVKQFVKKRFK